MIIFDTSLETFDRDVLAASCERPVLVDFRAEWCSPCLVIVPVLEHLMRDLAGAPWLAKLEVDQGENMKLAGRYLVGVSQRSFCLSTVGKRDVSAESDPEPGFYPL